MQERARSIGVGAMILAIAALHQTIGVLVGLGAIAPGGELTAAMPLVDLVRDGVVGAVEPHPDRMVLAWFLLFGFVLAIVGQLARAIELRSALDRGFAASFAAMCMLGVLLMPASGFWLGFVPAIVAWRRARPAAESRYTAS